MEIPTASVSCSTEVFRIPMVMPQRRASRIRSLRICLFCSSVKATAHAPWIYDHIYYFGQIVARSEDVVNGVVLLSIMIKSDPAFPSQTAQPRISAISPSAMLWLRWAMVSSSSADTLSSLYPLWTANSEMTSARFLPNCYRSRQSAARADTPQGWQRNRLRPSCGRTAARPGHSVSAYFRNSVSCSGSNLGRQYSSICRTSSL